MTCHNEHFNENSKLFHPEKNIQPNKPHILGEDNYNVETIYSLNSKGPNPTNEESENNFGNLLSQEEDNEEKDYSLNSNDNIISSNQTNEEFRDNLGNSFSQDDDSEEKDYSINSNDNIFLPYPIIDNFGNNFNDLFKNNHLINPKNETLTPKFNTTKKRGRKTEKLSQKSHDSSSDDNCLLKIQNNFFNFIIKLTNEVLNKENIKEEFIPVDYKIKRKVTHLFFCELKKKSIKDILEMDNSPKYRSKKKDFNKKTLNKIYKYSDWLKDFFNINYLKLFTEYHNNEKPLIKFVFKGKEIELNKTKSFYYLLKNKNNKGKKIEKDLSNIAKRFFIDDNSTFNKILFKAKKSIDLKE